MSLSHWQSALSAQGAHINQQVVEHFGDARTELKSAQTDNVICDLSHLGLLEVSGEDAVDFLQGQLTNDAKALNGSNAHLSGYCNPKGRMLALFLAFAHQDHLHLQLPHSLLAPLAKRLNMFVMRSKVKIADMTDRTIKIGVSGPDATQLLTSQFSQLPEQTYGLTSTEEATIIKLPNTCNLTRYEVFTTSEAATSLWNALNGDCKPVGKPCWDWLETQAGVPEVFTETQQQFVPQMLNLDLLGGINFKKGCYTGQEIVARTHYLGKVKRRTYLAEIDIAKLESETIPAAGDKLFDPAESDVGQIVRVAPHDGTRYAVLVELRTEAQEAGDIVWQGEKLSFKELPYSLAVADD